MDGGTAHRYRAGLQTTGRRGSVPFRLGADQPGAFAQPTAWDAAAENGDLRQRHNPDVVTRDSGRPVSTGAARKTEQQTSRRVAYFRRNSTGARCPSSGFT